MRSDPCDKVPLGEVWQTRDPMKWRYRTLPAHAEPASAGVAWQISRVYLCLQMATILQQCLRACLVCCVSVAFFVSSEVGYAQKFSGTIAPGGDWPKTRASRR